jgi:hypothetical protein
VTDTNVIKLAQPGTFTDSHSGDGSRDGCGSVDKPWPSRSLWPRFK